MIHRMYSWCIEIARSTGSTCTDWIQAIAALIAVPGAIAGFIVLFRRDKQKDAMIKELGKLAQESMKQTKHLADQVTYLSRQVQELKGIQSAIADGTQSKERAEAEKRDAKMKEAKPEFVGSFTSIKTQHQSIYFTNQGGDAKNFRQVENDRVVVRFPKELVQKGEKLQLMVSWKGSLPAEDNFEIEYDDAMGNRYRQRFELRFGQYSAKSAEMIRKAGSEDPSAS